MKKDEKKAIFSIPEIHHISTMMEEDRLIEVTCVFGRVPPSRPPSAAAVRPQGDDWVGTSPWAF